MTGNPLFPGFYADPEIRIFNDRYYVYSTFSAPYGQQTFFDVWTSADLTRWVKKPRILDFADVPWSTGQAAWAPSAISRDGKYYLYFSAGDGAGIGVAVASSPEGPFLDALGKPLISGKPYGAQPIDANAFIDDDGQAYLYFGGWGHCVVVSLNGDLISHKSDFKEITPRGYVEGPFMLKRNGIYYFMWSEGSWTDSTYGVSYATAASPTGPFTIRKKILESDPRIAKGPGHHSVLNIPGTDDWYIVYHRRPLDLVDRDHRVVCIDKLWFDAEGFIEKIKMTAEGVPPRPLSASSPKA